MKRLCWKRNLSPKRSNQIVGLKQHVLFDAMIVSPHRRLGKAIQKEVQRTWPELIEIHHQRLRRIDVGMRL